jgi:hypothetical protein
MADMFAIVEKDSDVLLSAVFFCHVHAWQDYFKRNVEGVPHENLTLVMASVPNFKKLGYRCIPVTVTPKGKVACRLCYRFKACSNADVILDCTNGSEFKPYAPIQLYSVTGE